MKRLFSFLAMISVGILCYAQLDSTVVGLARTSSPAALYLASIDPSTGVVSNLSSTSVGTSFTLTGTTIDTDLQIYYYISIGRIVGLDLTTGNIASDPLISGADYFDGLVYNKTDSLIYGLARSSSPASLHLATIDPSTGVVSYISSSSVGTLLSLNGGFTIDPVQGRYYFNNATEFVGLDLTTGAIMSNPQPSTSLGPYFDGAVYNPADGQIYGLTRNSSPAALYLSTIDPITGVVSNISSSSIGTGMTLTGTTIDPVAGTYHYVGIGTFVSVDLATGNLLSAPTISNTNGTYFDAIVYNGSAGTPPPLPTIEVLDTISICQGDSAFLAGAYQTMAGTFVDSFIAPSGQDSILMTTLLVNDTASHVIAGTIFFQGQPITAGAVILIESQSFSIVDSMGVNPDGSYLFDSIGSGTYLVQALGDPSLYVSGPTYADSAYDWQNAMTTTFSGGCLDTMPNMNVFLLPIPSLVGPGTISGRLTSGDAATGISMAGHPLYLVDVNTGAIAYMTMSDANGEFIFSDIAIGSYRIFMDQTGFLMDESTIFEILDENSVFETGVCVHEDDSYIEICGRPVTSVAPTLLEDFHVFPNPFSSAFSIEWQEQTSPWSYRVMNMMGQTMMKQEGETAQRLNIDLSGQPAGIYLLHIRQANQADVVKLRKD